MVITKNDLYQNQYNYETLKANIYAVSLLDILKTQIVTKEFCVKYILNKNYQDIFNEYKKITREDLKNYANKIFNFNSTDFLITTLSPVKIKDTIYANIYAF